MTPSRWQRAQERTRRYQAEARRRGATSPIPAPAPGTTRIDILAWFRQELFLAALLPLGLGVAAEVAAVFDLTYPPHQLVIRIVLGILGLPFIGTGLGLYIWLFGHPPREYLDVDTDGLTSRGRHGVGWHLQWSEIMSQNVIHSRPRLEDRVNARGVFFVIYLPRYFLRLQLAPTTARAHSDELDLGETLSRRPARQDTEPVDYLVNLGIPPATSRHVLDALGPRCAPQHVVRERRGELPRNL